MKFKIGDHVRYVNTTLDIPYKFLNGKLQILFYNDAENTYLVIGENEGNEYSRYAITWVKESYLKLWNECDDFNMKVVCTKSDEHSHYSFIPGKVYEIKNGQLIGSDGYRYGRYTSLNELNNVSGFLGRHCQFIEFKGEA